MTIIHRRTPADKRELYETLRPLLVRPKGPDQDGRIMSFCPAHADGHKRGNRSLSLHPTIGVTCFAGCEFVAILQSFGVAPGRREIPETLDRGEQGELVATYEYRTVGGDLVAEKLRYEMPGGKKRFVWQLPGHSGGGLNGLRMDQLPLYQAEILATAPMDRKVYFVEGEKAAIACMEQGLVAVTTAGGASQKDFGSSLEILRGRTVLLWPDNDGPGQEFAGRVEAALRSIASAVHYVALPFQIDAKGDAWDFFRIGGTVSSLEEGTITETTGETLGHDSIRVQSPTAKGVFEFLFSDIQQGAREIVCDLTVSARGGRESERYSQRINILSASQMTELRRSLDLLFGKEAGWAVILNSAINIMRGLWSAAQRAEDVFDIPYDTSSELLLVDPFLPVDSPTILFGDGDSGKSWFAYAMALCTSLGEPFMGNRTPQTTTLVIDWEGNRTTFRRRIRRLAEGLGLPDVPPEALFYWDARGVPLAEQTTVLAAFIQRMGIGLVVIDSIGPACGGEPERADVAISYFRALARLGKVTTLSIGHVTKGGETRKPFGSTYWHNEARRTWYMEASREGWSGSLEAGLFCRKNNDGIRPADQPILITYDDPHGPVVVESGDFSATPQLQVKRTWASRIWDAVGSRGPLTVNEVMDELEIPEEDRKTSRDSIEKTAKRMTSIGYGYLPAKKGQAIWRVEKREDEGEGSNNIGRHSF